MTSASVEAGTVVLASAASQKIYVHDFLVVSTGNAAGATNITIECSGGNDIAAIPVANLTSGTLATSHGANVTLGSAQVFGCPTAEAVQVIATGSTLTGSSQFDVLLQYTVQ